MAHKVFHRSLTAGVALAGAGAIAFSTLPVLPTDHAVSAPLSVAAVQPYDAPRVVTTEVAHASLVRSLEILANGAAGALGESFAAFSTQMPALFRQVQAQWADPDLTPWNHSLIAEAFFTPIAPLVVGPFTDAVAEVLAQTFPSRGDEIRENFPEAVSYAFARLVGPIISAIGATGAVHQQIYAAGMAGNPPGQWLAILRAPGTIIDGFLNGGYGDISALLTGQVGGDRIAAPGLFTPWGQYPVDRSVTDDWDGIPSESTDTEQRASTLADDADEVSDETVGTTEETEVSPVSAEVTDETEPVEAAEESAVSDEAEESTESEETGSKPDKTEKAESDKADKAESEKAESEKSDKASESADSDKGGKPSRSGKDSAGSDSAA